MKKQKSKMLLLLLFSLLGLKGIAADTIRVLTKDAFLSIVKTHHPVIKQAALSVDRAKAEILQARGAFDPVIKTDYDRKTFDGDLYYSYFNPQISIPTWYGVELKAGLEEVLGNRVTSESTFGQTSYAGVKLSLNNIVFDKQRAVLRQAQVFKKQSETERQLIINNLLYDAMSAYWNWTKEYQNYNVIKNAIAVNEARYKFVKLEYELGSRPAIDTTEALTQLQNFYLLQSETFVSYQNAGLELCNYLWLDNNTPLYWDNQIIPDSTNTNSPLIYNDIEPVITFITDAANHPKLVSISYKMDMLQIEKKLKQQYFLPKLSANANVLNKGYYIPDAFNTPFLENNNKIGFDFSIPLLLREARGGYRATKLKLLETNFEQSSAKQQIEVKVKSYYNDFLALKNQIEIFTNAYQNYQKLYQAERIRFEVGESSLFILNARENKLLESAQKLIDLKMKLNKTYVGLIWATGQLR